MKNNYEGFASIYKELGELIGEEKTLLIYKNMSGQQVTFSKKLYSSEYVKEMLSIKYTGNNLRELAKELDYTERHLRKMLKEIS